MELRPVDRSMTGVDYKEMRVTNKVSHLIPNQKLFDMNASCDFKATASVRDPSVAKVKNYMLGDKL